MLWPRRSFSRSFRYFARRILRLKATPHAIAAGFAAGVFSAFTPFLGFHFVIAFVVAWALAGNMASAALGTLVGNPLTLPFIWGATFELGDYLLHQSPIDGEPPRGLASALGHGDITAIWKPVLEPMLAGSLPLGLGAAIVGYGAVYIAARSFQERRRQASEERRALLLSLQAGGGPSL